MRKTVTVLFCDLVGSTELGERLDPEALRAVLDRYFDAVREAVERHAGIVEKYIGDAVMAVFGVPVVHEDDALRAVRAAATIPGAVARLDAELRRRWGARLEVRVGLSTGEVVTGAGASGGQRLATGDTVNLAARLQVLAGPGEVVMSEPTYQLVRNTVRAEALPAVTVKGKAHPVRSWRLVAVGPPTGQWTGSGTALVGRGSELAALRAAWQQAVRERALQRRTIIGEAGVGKSRLLADFAAGLPAGTMVLHGRCLSYGQGITFWPVREMLASAAGWRDDDSADQALAKLAGLLPDRADADRVSQWIGQLLGMAPASTLQEGFWALAQLLGELARRAPLLVVADDLHWAEPTLLDLLDHLQRTVTGPVLLLGAARPDLLDAQQPGPEDVRHRILLEPLPADDAARLLDVLLAPGGPPTPVRDHVLATSGGNPLFAEQLVAMLVDDGSLHLRDGRWALTRVLDATALPGSITTLLAARLDRLADAEQHELEAGAVVGQVFWRGAVAELARDVVGPDAGTHLSALVGRRLISPEASTFPGDEAYKFAHVLVRDAAYRAIPKAERAAAHQQFARWLDRVAGDRAGEYEEILGYHLEQAVMLRADVALQDDGDAELAVAAGRHLAAAGDRAVGRGDLTTTIALLTRAERLLAGDPALRADVLVDLGTAHDLAGHVEQAQQRLAAALELAQSLDDQRLQIRVRIALFAVWSSSARDETQSSDQMLPQLESAIASLTNLGDDTVLAEAWWAVGMLRFDTGHLSDAMPALERARHHGRRSGRAVVAAMATGLLAQSLVEGPTPVRTVVDQLDRLARETGDNPLVRHFLIAARAETEAMTRNFDRAWELVEQVRSLRHELGSDVGEARFVMVVFDVARRQDNLALAEPVLRAADDILAALGEQTTRSTVLAMRAHVHAAADQLEEAERCAELGRSMTEPNDFSSQVLWRSALAQVHSRRGDHGTADGLATEAIDIAAGSDWLCLHGDSILERADIRRRWGRHEDAARDADAALALYESKGDQASADRARRMLRELYEASDVGDGQLGG